ncbi:DNA-3-methyladenine glycosidase [Escherichia coli]|nr:DNA-3-methyladenine glycosidase [Escherichia coli]EEW9411104.1 DNA-3-methyladenine glycosidase [Escherichia coli]EFO4256533.1 DNA-3-methyladenine glycosidase [Escherichia coli]EGD9747128.1 DNA-3-methyladenine glycosidase [Escherichia coli]PQV24177.1 DNA-3-methyladenine glycosidase [Escherichia coli]
MPVKKGRDFSEMLPSRQPECESKAQRLNNVYAESG